MRWVKLVDWLPSILVCWHILATSRHFSPLKTASDFDKMLLKCSLFSYGSYSEICTEKSTPVIAKISLKLFKSLHTLGCRRLRRRQTVRYNFKNLFLKLVKPRNKYMRRNSTLIFLTHRVTFFIPVSKCEKVIMRLPGVIPSTHK